MENLDRSIIEDLVRKIIKENLSGVTNVNADRHVDQSGIMSVKLPMLKLEKFDTGKSQDNVMLRDALSLEESPRLGCGLMEMKETTFDWTLMYDEIQYVIEGRLEINIDGRKVWLMLEKLF